MPRNPITTGSSREDLYSTSVDSTLFSIPEHGLLVSPTNMANDLSFMLDDMVAAVNGGLSYDGIVSVPQIGLEDAEYRSSIASSLRQGIESVVKTGASISQKAAKVLKQIQNRQNVSSLKPENETTRRDVINIPFTRPYGVKRASDSKLSVSSENDQKTDTRNHFSAQDRGIPERRKHDLEMVYGCFLSAPTIGRTHSEPINLEHDLPSYIEQESVGGDWELVSDNDLGRSQWAHRTGEGFSRSFQGSSSSGQLSEENEEDKDRVHKDEVCPLMKDERLPRKRDISNSNCEENGDGLVPRTCPFTMPEKERLPRKKSDGEIRLGFEKLKL